MQILGDLRTTTVFELQNMKTMRLQKMMPKINQMLKHQKNQI